MALRIEDYALIGDTESAALVGRNGSIDWMCLPSFSSDACFAALLGDERNGRWWLAPAGRVLESRRRYRPGTLILETIYKTDDGEVRVIDCMPPRGENPDIVRIVEGISGEVAMRMDLAVRFGYGAVLPWIRKTQKGFTLLAGPDALSLLSSGAVVSVDGPDLRAEFRVHAQEQAMFQLTWHASYKPAPEVVGTDLELRDTEVFWRDWSSRCSYNGRYRDLVLRSLVTLKALTYLPTGGIVAAATTSLPERIGGVRNWDYRVCWVRDATFTLLALIGSGFKAEAEAWCNWLMRGAAGHP